MLMSVCFLSACIRPENPNTPMPYYTLNFETNGGTSIPPESHAEGSLVMPPQIIPMKRGHVFEGWYVDKACIGVAGFPLEMRQSLTLYAKWTELPKFTVTFDTNGGSGRQPVWCYMGETIDEPAAPVKSGNRFAGWYLDQYLVAAVPSFPFTPIGDMTMYAKWIIQCTVVYETNGGTSIASVTVNTGTAINRPEDPARGGYRFDGWYRNAGLTQAASFPFNITQNTTIYAKWIAQYTVTFETNGGSGISPVTFDTGTSINKPEDPAKNTFTFAGWYQDSGFTTAASFPFPLTKNITLYAKWLGTYTVTFETNSGSAINPITGLEGTSISRPLEPTRDGYRFDGWYKDEGFSQAAGFPFVLTQNIMIYAKWVARYTVTFETNGGTNINPITADVGTVVNEPAQPSKNGFTFGGWYKDSGYTQAASFPFNLSQNTSIYVKWLGTFTVAFDANGGSDISSITKLEGTIINKPSDPVKNGNGLKAWYKDSNFIEAVDFPFVLTENITLYAKWVKFTDISAGQFHSFAIAEDGSLWAWGSNNTGMLGDGTRADKNKPVQINIGTKFMAVAAGSEHSLALDENGGLWAWRSNFYGQLGDGTKTMQTLPVRINAGTKFKAVAAGSAHSLAIAEDGGLWVWGNNNAGQLGDGTLTEKDIPVLIKSDTKFISIAAGDSHSLAIAQNGGLWVWGRNNYGQLGDGTKTDRTSPRQIKSGTLFKVIASGGNHSSAITVNGELWTWGRNDSGQLGDDTYTDSAAPIHVNPETKFISVSAAYTYSLAIGEDGGLWVCGYNALKQMDVSYSKVFVRINADTKFRLIAAGATHGLVMSENGDFWAWGSNDYGQLGNGITTA